MTRRVAAIDCGTNSIRLLVADMPWSTGGAAGRRGSHGCRSSGSARASTGPAGWPRPRSSGPGWRWRSTPTRSRAGRRAGTDGRDLRLPGRRQRRRVPGHGAGRRSVRRPEVVTGDEEARLSFVGAVTGLPSAPGAVPGGRHRRRLDRVRCRHDRRRACDQHGHRLCPDDRAAPARRSADTGADHRGRGGHHAAVDQALSAVPGRDASTLVGLAGSVTTVTGIALGLDHYAADRIHHARATYAQVGAVTRQLLAQTAAQRLQNSDHASRPGRCDRRRCPRVAHDHGASRSHRGGRQRA